MAPSGSQENPNFNTANIPSFPIDYTNGTTILLVIQVPPPKNLAVIPLSLSPPLIHTVDPVHIPPNLFQSSLPPSNGPKAIAMVYTPIMYYLDY